MSTLSNPPAHEEVFGIMDYAFAGIALCALALFGTCQYGWNVSALLHMDVAFGVNHAVAPGVVLYSDGGYDGMLYYEVAKDLPLLFSGRAVSLDSRWSYCSQTSPRSSGRLR